MAARLSTGRDGAGCCLERNLELIPGNDVALRSPRIILREVEGDGQEVFRSGRDCRLLQIESDFFRHAGWQIVDRHIAALNLLSVFFQRP